MEQFDVETPASYLLTFNDDGEGALSITVGPMTMTACPPDSRSDQFVTLLGAANHYFFVDGALFIDLMADGGTMRLEPAGEVDVSPEGAAAAAAEAAQLQASCRPCLPGSWTTRGYGPP